MLTATSQIELGEQCRKLEVAKLQVTVLISKNREEIELSAARNCFLCQMLRNHYEGATRFGGPGPFKIGDIVYFDHGFFGGKWHLFDWGFDH